ncbi:MAG: S-methyl-5'-thioadenosine phosphorylase [Candidatus Micrarchaeaceae archaeon]
MDATIGIIGGSGLYSLLEDAEEVNIETKYGKPSDAISIGTFFGKKVAFLPRHSKRHTIQPHRIPFRANIDALSQLGVVRVIATNAVGSLKPDYKPGELALPDQFVNATHGRHDTFFDEDVVVHVSSAEPYCPQLRELAAGIAEKEKIPMHGSGTVVVINGPRFSSKAESMAFSSQGHHMIGMTQYPEIVLARERQMCYAGIALITDYDAGLTGRPDIKPVTNTEVTRISSQNIEKAVRVISGMIKDMPSERLCECSRALEGAVATKLQK